MVCLQAPRLFQNPYTSIDISWLRGRRESRSFIPLALNFLVLSMEEIIWIETSYWFSEQSIKRFNFPLLSCMISLCSLEKSILSPWLYHGLLSLPSPETGLLESRAEPVIVRGLHRGKLAAQDWLWAAFAFGAISDRIGERELQRFCPVVALHMQAEISRILLLLVVLSSP